MEKEIAELSFKLKQSIQENDSVKELEMMEKEMNNNEEVMKLSYLKDMALEDYSNGLKIYSEDSEEIKNLRNKLSVAKNNLQSHPLVKKYLKVYSEVRDLYNEINSILFADFNYSTCKKDK